MRRRRRVSSIQSESVIHISVSVVFPGVSVAVYKTVVSFGIFIYYCFPECVTLRKTVPFSDSKFLVKILRNIVYFIIMFGSKFKRDGSFYGQ